MAYNIVPASVERVRSYLEILKNSEGVITFNTARPETLRYAIYEGLAAATELKYPEYEEIRSKYTISCGTDKVVCSPTKPETLKVGSLILEDVTDWIEAIGATLRNQEVKIGIIYPNLVDDDGQFRKWCEGVNSWNIVKLPTGYKIWK